MSRPSVLCSLLLVSVSIPALAQSPCPTQEILGSAAKRSSDLVCIVPQVYGAGGLVGVELDDGAAILDAPACVLHPGRREALALGFNMQGRWP